MQDDTNVTTGPKMCCYKAGGVGGHSEEHSVQSVTYVQRPCSISQVYEIYVGQCNLFSAGNSHSGASHLDT